MFKRIMLGLTFVAAFSVVGVGITDNAEAWRRWRRPYVSYYSSPSRNYYYGGYVPYRTYYRGYAPQYYRGYSRYYGYPDDYYYGPRRGVSVSFGF